MRKLILAALLLGLADPLPAAELQLARTQPRLDLVGHDHSMAALSPSLRDWVSARSRAIVDSGVAPDPAQIGQDAETRLAGQDFSGADIDALIELVMMESAKQAEADLRETAAQMQAAIKRKEMMRAQKQAEAQADAAAGSAAQAAKIPVMKATCVDPPCSPPLAPVRPQLSATQPQVRMAQPRIQLAMPASVDTSQLKDQKDSLSDVSEMDSLRLQMMMDRRSKFIEALSNLMKKNSDTASTITSNLK